MEQKQNFAVRGRWAVEDYKDYEPGVFSRDRIATVQSMVNAVSDIIFQTLYLNFIVTKKHADPYQQSQKTAIFRICSTIF